MENNVNANAVEQETKGTVMVSIAKSGMETVKPKIREQVRGVILNQIGETSEKFEVTDKYATIEVGTCAETGVKVYANIEVKVSTNKGIKPKGKKTVSKEETATFKFEL